jgi:hypothetical protein
MTKAELIHVLDEFSDEAEIHIDEQDYVLGLLIEDADREEFINLEDSD